MNFFPSLNKLVHFKIIITTSRARVHNRFYCVVMLFFFCGLFGRSRLERIRNKNKGVKREEQEVLLNSISPHDGHKWSTWKQERRGGLIILIGQICLVQKLSSIAKIMMRSWRLCFDQEAEIKINQLNFRVS